MPSWRRKGNYPGESSDAFSDYIKVLSSTSFFKQTIEKYNIEYLLIPNSPGPETSKIRLPFEAEKITNLLFSNPNKSVITPSFLAKIGMKKVYQNQTAVVYVRY